MISSFRLILCKIVSQLNRKKDGLDNQSEELGRKLVQGDMELAAFMKVSNSILAAENLMADISCTKM